MKKKKSIYNKMKRFFDFVTAFFLGLILSPLLFALALIVKVTSKGPIFYRWQVVGEGGRYFTGFKFRSMFQNAEHLKDKLLFRNEMTGPMFKLSDDPRITPVGKFLRSSVLTSFHNYGVSSGVICPWWGRDLHCKLSTNGLMIGRNRNWLLSRVLLVYGRRKVEMRFSISTSG